MADYRTLSLAFLVIGFELCLFGVSNSQYVGEDNAVESLIISGFLAYLIACMLILFVKYGDLGASRIGVILAGVLGIVAGGLLIVGLGVYCDKVEDNPPPYPATMVVCSALFGLLGGLFLLVETCCH